MSSAITELAAPSLIRTGLVVAAGLLIGAHVAGAVLLALAVVAGLPHGASDLDTGRKLLRSSGPRWWVAFLVGYLGLIATTLAAWAIAPAVMLTAFLLLSIFHFGTQDTPDQTPIAVLAHGGAPIIAPALFHPQEVERLFAVLIGDQAHALAAVIAGPIAILWVAAIAWLVWRTVEPNTRSRETGAWPAPADLLLVVLLFAAASPLVAFSFYFALLHTPRALLEQRRRNRATASGFQTIGLTGLACLLGVGILLFSPGLTPGAAIVRTSFILLSALTVPHMALEYVAASSARERSAFPVGNDGSGKQFKLPFSRGA